MTKDSNIRRLETIPERSSKEVKEILQEWLEDDSITEIFIIGKKDGGYYRNDHSHLSSAFWWVGILKFFMDSLSDHQRDNG